MHFAEYDLWEIVVPHSVDFESWYETIRAELVDGGMMLLNNNLQGYWKSESEHCKVFRLACNDASIRRICQITSDVFLQESVLAYRVSTKCILGYNE